MEDGIVVDGSLAGTRYRFRHTLLRAALDGELSAAARIALHCAIGEAVERLHRPRLEPWFETLAHHFLRGAPNSNWRRAVHYAEAAAARALKRLAYEDADAYFEAALDVFEADGAVDEKHRCELLLSLGTCRHKGAGLEAARPVFTRAADGARVVGRPDLLARAALGFTPWTPYGRTSDSGVDLLEEALAAQPDAESALKAELLARLAHTLDGTAGARSPRERIVTLSRDAVRMARHTGALATLGQALFHARWVDWNPASFASRVAITDELLAVSQRLRDRELVVVGEGWRVADCLEAGDPSAMDGAMRRHAALASELREPEHLWWSAVWRAMRAVMEGRHPESEELIGQALELGGRVEPENALLVAYAQYSQLRTDRGQLEEALTDLEHVIAGRREVFEGDATSCSPRVRSRCAPRSAPWSSPSVHACRRAASPVATPSAPTAPASRRTRTRFHSRG